MFQSGRNECAPIAWVFAAAAAATRGGRRPAAPGPGRRRSPGRAAEFDRTPRTQSAAIQGLRARGTHSL
jgi:hypothetical protein